MWLTDSGTGRLYRLAGGRRRWSATVDATQFLYRGADILLLYDGQGLLFLPPGQNQVVRLVF